MTGEDGWENYVAEQDKLVAFLTSSRSVSAVEPEDHALWKAGYEAGERAAMEQSAMERGTGYPRPRPEEVWTVDHKTEVLEDV